MHLSVFYFLFTDIIIFFLVFRIICMWLFETRCEQFCKICFCYSVVFVVAC